MNIDRVAAEIHRVADPTRRRLFGLGIGGGLAGLLGLAEADAKKKRKKKKTCKGGKKKCGKQCIPKAKCCTDADCEPLLLCAQGTCVIGQGTCPTGLDGCQTSSNACGVNGEETCACFQSTVGETRCAGGLTLPGSTCGECINDADCHQLYPAVIGAFCARGGPNCGCPSPNSGFCQAPCPDQM